MDLLQTVRKEGSRGGVNFSWDDVKSANNRENYLGHSVMAPVGRWQKGRDLNWYAKADDAELTPEERAEKERERKREEMRKVKEAEEDAMARALGLPVPDRTNANNEPLGESKVSQKEVNKALKEALDDGDEQTERPTALGSSRREDRDRERRKSGRDDRRRDRSRSRDRRHRHRDERSDRKHRRSRSRSRGADRERRHRHRHHSRSRSRDRKERPRSRDREDRHRRRRENEDRSRSRERYRRDHRSRTGSPYQDTKRRESHGK